MHVLINRLFIGEFFFNCILDVFRLHSHLALFVSILIPFREQLEGHRFNASISEYTLYLSSSVIRASLR